MLSFEDIMFLDTETTGLNPFDGDKVFSIQWALGMGRVNYVDVRDEDYSKFIHELELCDTVVCHGTKFDAHMLKMSLDIDITEKKLDCTLIRAQLLDEHKFSYSLESLTGQKLDIIEDLQKIFGGPCTKNVQMANLHKAPKELVMKYANQDVVALRGLYLDQEKRVGSETLPPVHNLEKKVLKTLIHQEQLGMKVDIARAENSVGDMTRIVDIAQMEINKIIGKDFNVNSTPQMRDFFVSKVRKDGKMIPEIRHGKIVLIDGTLANKTKTGGASLDKELLSRMKHPASKLVLKIRKYLKTRDTFLVSQILNKNINGRVHPWFHQTKVVTGRLSCTGVNLQAVPKRDPEMKAILRPLFLPEKGKQLLRCDYDQSDVRGFAHYISEQWTGTEEHPVLKAYRKNPDTDFHTYVSKMLGIQRNPGIDGGANAKQINLAMIFNMGMGTLAAEMGLPYTEYESRGRVFLKAGKEAEEVFNLYHLKIPGAADMGKLATAVALRRGHVESIAGRFLRFPKKIGVHKASGYLYQSFTADLIKMAMVATEQYAPQHASIHDELLFSVESKEQCLLIQNAMQGVFKDLTKIPIRTQPEVGPNWGNTEKLI